MKSRIHILQCPLAALLAAAAAGSLPLNAAPPPQTPAKLESPPAVSSFVIPTSPSEGRDPFFPNSTRVYVTNPKNQMHGQELTGLALKAILGNPPHIFAIINNHTFASGDEGDITTKTGQRLHIACLGINPQAGTTIVEANGIQITLHLSGEL